ncbi:putative ArsR family transcriptional regulator [Sediminihabitans luteus]|uniref:Putative ArsR family transcriptional regulator n=1 Tax=Sediminihabitans luteus TaxID=1138585 RepID=A0A2M9CRF6_9CELL|nr:helix-turn-helix domain-containing protein [Sediminihabitans luteus]PJJ74421.1 putative ArsR family transcriptional regulator [Sediminihabitans luteus]GIJ00212.1 hypothetical protein Slu03_25890 [Sediminihabitans luteus]
MRRTFLATAEIGNEDVVNIDDVLDGRVEPARRTRRKEQAISPQTATRPPSPALRPAADDVDTSTRERVLTHVVADGPVSAAALARTLGLTPAGVRRHLAGLETDGLIAPHVAPAPTGSRGRPARRFVATSTGQAELAGAYPDLAAQALRFLRDSAGEAAVEAFAHARLDEFARRHAHAITAPDVEGRAAQLAAVLVAEGYAASVRPVGGTHTVQLCQGHCPVQHVAQEFPQLCEAEAQVFSRLLGTHVQRLATLAGGGHACTTSVPIHDPPSTTAPPAGPTHETTPPARPRNAEGLT